MGQQRFELLSSGNAIMDLQIISWDEQLWLDGAAVVEDLLLSWAPLHSGLGHDAPVDNVDYILCFLAAASLPKGVPLMHKQKDSTLRQRGGTRGQPARLPDSLHRRAAARRAEQQRAMQPLLAQAFTEDTLFQQLGRRRTSRTQGTGGFYTDPASDGQRSQLPQNR